MSLSKRAANPTQFFWKYPSPPEDFRRILYTNGGSLGQAFLAGTVETGTKSRCVSKPRMLWEESLGKIKFRAFPKRVGPRIPSLESVDYFGTSKHY